MNGLFLIDAIGNIDDELIADARRQDRRIPRWMNLAAHAACICCVVFAAVLALHHLGSQEEAVTPGNELAQMELEGISPEAAAASAEESAIAEETVLLTSKQADVVLRVPVSYQNEIQVDTPYDFRVHAGGEDWDFEQDNVIFSFFDQSQTAYDYDGLVWLICAEPIDQLDAALDNENTFGNNHYTVNDKILGYDQNNIYILTWIDVSFDESRQYLAANADTLQSYYEHVEAGFGVLEDFIEQNNLIVPDVRTDWKTLYKENIIDVITEQMNSEERELFFSMFHELDRESMQVYLEQNPAVLDNGWNNININRAGLDDMGTEIYTTEGEQVLAIDADRGILILRVYCNDSRGVMAILKDTSRLRLKPAESTQGQTLGEICNAIYGLAINGSAFIDDGSGNGGLLSGLAVYDGQFYGSRLGETYKRLELRDDGKMYLVDSAAQAADNTLQACEFKPALIVDGEIVVDENCGWTSPSPRTVIGQTDKLETQMVVIEGRFADSPGCSVVDIAELMHRYGCVQAMNLDGGTSSMMYYDGEYITRCSNTALPEGRQLPNAWVYQ